MKTKQFWISLMAALALGAASAAGTGAGTQINNTAQASYPDPDNVGGPAITVDSNTVTATVTAVPALSITPNGGAIEGGGSTAPFTPALYSSGVVTPGEQVVVLYTLSNDGNVDDRYNLVADVDTAAGIAAGTIKFYRYSDAGVDGVLSAGEIVPANAITTLGSEADNSQNIPRSATSTGTTSRFWMVYTAPSTGGAYLAGPVGTSALTVNGSGVNAGVDTDGNPLTAVTNPTVTYTGTKIFDGKLPDNTITPPDVDTLPDLDGSQNLHTLTVATGVVSGKVLRDDSNSVANNATEPGISGVTLTLQRFDGSAFVAYDPPGPSTSTTATDGNGAYSFSNLPAGTYRVLETQPTAYSDGKQYQGGVEVTTPANDVLEIVLAANTTSSGNDFGELGTAISGTVFNDRNGDGVNAADPADPGISGVTLQLQDSLGNPIDLDPVTAGVQSTVLTDSSGNYTFPNLPAGSYQVVQTQPTGYGSSTTNTVPVTLVAGTPGAASFGETLGTVTGRVYNDVNDDGDYDVGTDLPISGVTVYIDTNNNNAFDSGEPTTTTAALTGIYTFSDLLAGTYVVREVQPTNYSDTSNQENNDDFESVTLAAVTPGGGSGTVGTPTPGQTSTVNFGEREYADLSLTKTVTPRNATDVAPNNAVTFTLTISNAGPAAASGVVVTDVVPAGYTSLAESDPNASFTGNTLTWTVGTVAVGVPQTLTFTAVVASSNTVGVYRNVAEITASSQPDPDSTPNNGSTTEDDDGVAQLGALFLNKQVRNVTTSGTFGTTAVGKPDDILEYCIGVKNLNTGTLTGVTFSDAVASTLEPQTGAVYGSSPDVAVRYTQTAPSAATLDFPGTAFTGQNLSVSLGNLLSGTVGTVCFQAKVR